MSTKFCVSKSNIATRKVTYIKTRTWDRHQKNRFWLFKLAHCLFQCNLIYKLKTNPNEMLKCIIFPLYISFDHVTFGEHGTVIRV